jgi:hypothetical protein
MRRSLLIAAGLASFGVFASYATVASAAEYGAIAYDGGTGRWGDSWHYASVAAANGRALSECATGRCKIVIEIGPGQCGALATAPNPTGWGAATRGSRAASELGAMQACQNANSGQCKVVMSDCNK